MVQSDTMPIVMNIEARSRQMCQMRAFIDSSESTICRRDSTETGDAGSGMYPVVMSGVLSL